MTPTIEDLKREAEKTVIGKLHWTIQNWAFNKPSYADWVSLVEDAVAHAILLIASQRNNFFDLDEDALSGIVNTALRFLNLNASSMSVNGNADVVVEFDAYKWLAEAKIAKDLSKIYHGYEQLTSRYATGMEGQTSGAMLLYCTHDNAKVTLSGWRAALEEQLENCNSRDGRAPLSFCSDGICDATGAALDIVHFALPLHHSPQEDQRFLSPESMKAAAAARKQVRKESEAAVKDGSAEAA